MSEMKDKVENKPAAKAKPKKQGSGSSGALLAMIIAIGAAAGSYYIWQQHLIAEQDRLVLEESIEELLKVVEQRDQAQQQRIEQLRQHQHAELSQRLSALEQTLPELSQQLSVQQQEWTLAEVDYLLRTAEHRLQLNRDIPTAITALSQARDQLVKYSNGHPTTVIDAIERKITELSQMDQDALSQITHRLGAVITSIEELPFALTAEGESPALEPLSPLPEDAGFTDKLGHWGKRVWRDVKSLVTIRPSDKISHPLIEPEQRYLLQTQLRIKLETARLAAMDHNQPLYRATIDEASRLLNRFYDSNDSSVVDTLATLSQLRTLEVAPELPSIGALRLQLHAAEQQAPNEVSAPPAPEPIHEPLTAPQAPLPPFEVSPWGNQP